MRTFQPSVSRAAAAWLPAYHHRSDALVCEQLEQECVVDIAVDDVRVLPPLLRGP